MVELSFDMQPQALHANLAVTDDRGRIAFQRGPIVYCMEQLDQAVAPGDAEGLSPLYGATYRDDGELISAGATRGRGGIGAPGRMAPGTQPGNLYQATLPNREAVQPPRCA